MKYLFKSLLLLAIPLFLTACSDYIEESEPLVGTIKSKLSSSELASFENWLDDGDNEERISEALYSMALQAYPNEVEELESINRYNDRLSSYTKYVILDNLLQGFNGEEIVVWDRPNELEEILSQLPESIRVKVDRTISENGFSQIQTFISLANATGVSSAFAGGLIDVYFTPEENSAIATLDANRPSAVSVANQERIARAQDLTEAINSELTSAEQMVNEALGFNAEGMSEDDIDLSFKVRNGMLTVEEKNLDKIGDFCALLGASTKEISSVEEIYNLISSSGVWSGRSIEFLDDLPDDELARVLRENTFIMIGIGEVRSAINEIKVERQGQGVRYDQRRCSLAVSSAFN